MGIVLVEDVQKRVEPVVLIGRQVSPDRLDIDRLLGVNLGALICVSLRSSGRDLFPYRHAGFERNLAPSFAVHAKELPV